jgi:hypothetical protein
MLRRFGITAFRHERARAHCDEFEDGILLGHDGALIDGRNELRSPFCPQRSRFDKQGE